MKNKSIIPIPSEQELVDALKMAVSEIERLTKLYVGKDNVGSDSFINASLAANPKLKKIKKLIKRATI